MFLQTQNPFSRTSKVHLQYSVPLTHSSPNIIGPTRSICPKKKYSNNIYQPSNLQLSEKICYRMNAQFHKLQSMELQDIPQYNHGGQCILNSYCKKNPFEKKYLSTWAPNQSNKQSWKYYENQNQSSNRQFRDPQELNRYQNVAREYGQLKKKLQYLQSQKFISNLSIFGEKNPYRMTFGDLNFSSTSLKNQLSSSERKLFKRTSSKQLLLKFNKNQFGNEQSDSANKRISKNFSNDSFSGKKKLSSVPAKIKYQNSIFYLTPVSPPNWS